jgi:putative acetyltransferase
MLFTIRSVRRSFMEVPRPLVTSHAQPANDREPMPASRPSTQPHIVIVTADPLLAAARSLITEYGESIADVAACSLEHQNFTHELATLPGAYAPPRGRLLLAFIDSQPAGCIALRPLDNLGPHICEMKRLYVPPARRATGLGRLLVNRLLDEARAIGYTLMKLDTDTNEKFAAAIALYKSLGFRVCDRYNSDPDPKTLWFEKDL